MRIENTVISKNDQLFTVITEIGDINIRAICLGCPLVRLGCSHFVDTNKGTILARVNLLSPRVKQFAGDENESLNCGATKLVKDLVNNK